MNKKTEKRLKDLTEELGDLVSENKDDVKLLSLVGIGDFSNEGSEILSSIIGSHMDLAFMIAKMMRSDEDFKDIIDIAIQMHEILSDGDDKENTNTIPMCLTSKNQKLS